MAIGYIELDDWIPFRKMFAYMDASDHYRADELLRKYKLKVKFKNEWCAPNNRYRMIFCTVPRKQWQKCQGGCFFLDMKIILNIGQRCSPLSVIVTLWPRKPNC